MKITLKTTEHNTTQDEQWQKFLDELEEFQEAREDYINAIANADIVTDKSIEFHKSDVVDEGIDACKSLSKWGKTLYEYDVFTLVETSSQYFDYFEMALQRLQEDPNDFKASIMISHLLYYLVKFCQENNLDFETELKKNDEKNERKGTMKKVYLSDEEIIILNDISKFLGVKNQPQTRVKLDTIIEKIQD